MRAVRVHLDAGLRLRFGVGVAADVRAPVQHQDPLVQLGRHALGDRQAEETGTDDKEVKTSGHRQPGYRTGLRPPESHDWLKVSIRSQLYLTVTVTSVPSTTSHT